MAESPEIAAPAGRATVSNRLAERIPLILDLWEERVRLRLPAAREQDPPILRDDIPPFLLALARSLSPVAAPEEVGGGDDRSAHGTVFIGALRPCQGIIEPEVETHEIQLTTGPINSVTAAARASGEKGLLNVRQARNAVAKFCSGFEET